MDKNKSSSEEKKFDKSFRPREIRVSDNKILDSFKCIICHELVWYPIFCKNNNCGKPVCEDCITVHYNSKNIEKFPCVMKCKSIGYRKSTYKENEFMDFIKAKCINQGCSQFINYSDYQNHLSKCIYSISHCSNKNCNYEGYLFQMGSHAKQCEYRKIECDKCKKIIIFNSKENHIMNDCPETIISCIFCNQKMKRIDYINSHKSKNANCLKLKVENYSKKLKDNKIELNAQKDEIENLKKSVEELTKKVKEYELKLKKQRDEIESLKQNNIGKKKYIEEFRTFIQEGYNRFKGKDNQDEINTNININKEMQKKDNLFINTESTSNLNKQQESRNKIIAINNQGSLTEKASTKTIRKTKSEANFENYSNKK